MIKPVRAGNLADTLQLPLDGDPEQLICGVGTLKSATPEQLTFLANPAYAKFLPDTQAGLVIIDEKHADQCPVSTLTSTNPYADYARAATLLVSATSGGTATEQSNEPRIDPSAVIDASARIGSNVRIGAHCVIEANAVIGDHCDIGHRCLIGRGCQVAEQTRLYPAVTLYHEVSLGQRCIVHSGAVIGADGFGIASTADGWLKVPQLGSVVIGDDCEVGANTTIDRGAIEDTVLGDDVKLDNQIQIGHNVVIGSHTAIAGCVAIAGSARIGAHCLIGGGAGIVGHIEICDRVTVMARSFVTSSIRKPGQYSSVTPMQEHSVWIRNAARMKQLDQLARTIKELERKLLDDREQ